jgi:DNA-binding CsgD family transcriptional regulator
MRITLNEDGEKGHFIGYIHHRIKHNKNFLCCVTGPTGSGKSWCALRMGEMIDPDFDIRNVVFTPKEFLELVNEKSKKLSKGSCIVFDELQVSMSHVEYMSLQSKLINYLLQTFRHRNFVCIFTSPHFSFVNASARKLFHSRVETLDILTSKNVVRLKPFMLQVNQDTGKVYRKYLRVFDKEYGRTPVKTLLVGKPSKDLIKAYEEKKTDFTTNLNRTIMMDLERLEEKQNKRRELTDIQKKMLRLYKEGKTIKQIAETMSVSEQAIHSYNQLIRRKGYDILPIKNGRNIIRYEVAISR